MGSRRTVLAIDPGRSKCGIAVVAHGTLPEVLYRAVVATDELCQVLSDLAGRFDPEVLVVGNGTTASVAARVAEATGIPVEIVDERFTSIEARKRYFAEHPPRGLRRLIPVSLQTPPQPIDDYVATILAERYLHKTSC